MNEKEGAIRDALVLGTGIVKTGRRRWYNPMRWIAGLLYQKRIDPRQMFAK